MIGYISFISLTLVSFLLLVGQFSKSYKKQRLRLENLVAQDIILRIENIKTYGREENGWKNNFPSVLGWERTTLQISKNFILVTGKSSFPFLFKSEIQPFIISFDPQFLSEKLDYNQVFRPYNIRVTNYGGDLELTIKPSGLVGQMKVHLIFENIGSNSIEKLFEVTNWR